MTEWCNGEEMMEHNECAVIICGSVNVNVLLGALLGKEKNEALLTLCLVAVIPALTVLFINSICS